MLLDGTEILCRVPFLDVPLPVRELGEFLQTRTYEIPAIEKDDNGFKIDVRDGVMEVLVLEIRSKILFELQGDGFPGNIEIVSHWNEDPFVLTAAKELVVKLGDDCLFRAFPRPEYLDLLDGFPRVYVAGDGQGDRGSRHADEEGIGPDEDPPWDRIA